MAAAKRTAEDVARPAPEAKKAACVSAPSWRAIDFELINKPEIVASRSQYGGWSVSWTYGKHRQPLTFTGPRSRVVHEPSIWDEEKEAAFGKSGHGLDPKRSSDKWSVSLALDVENFITFIERLVHRFASDIFEAQEKILPKGSKPMTVEVIESKFYSIIKIDKRTGERTLDFDGRCNVGAASVPLCLVDEDGATLEKGAQLGRGSEVNPVMSLTSARIAENLQNVKVYTNPIKFVVRTLAPPVSVATNPDAIRAEIDD